MRVPRILSHVFDHPSTTVTLGYMVFLAATGGLFYKRIIDADTWLWCTCISSILVGGKLVSKSMLEAIQMKITKGAVLPAEISPKEEKADAPTPPVA